VGCRFEGKDDVEKKGLVVYVTLEHQEHGRYATTAVIRSRNRMQRIRSLVIQLTRLGTDPFLNGELVEFQVIFRGQNE
jgi:hypothetical protein